MSHLDHHSNSSVLYGQHRFYDTQKDNFYLRSIPSQPTLLSANHGFPAISRAAPGHPLGSCSRERDSGGGGSGLHKSLKEGGERGVALGSKEKERASKQEAKERQQQHQQQQQQQQQQHHQHHHHQQQQQQQQASLEEESNRALERRKASLPPESGHCKEDSLGRGKHLSACLVNSKVLNGESGGNNNTKSAMLSCGGGGAQTRHVGGGNSSRCAKNGNSTGNSNSGEMRLSGHPQDCLESRQMLHHSYSVPPPLSMSSAAGAGGAGGFPCLQLHTAHPHHPHHHHHHHNHPHHPDFYCPPPPAPLTTTSSQDKGGATGRELKVTGPTFVPSVGHLGDKNSGPFQLGNPDCRGGSGGSAKDRTLEKNNGHNNGVPPSSCQRKQQQQPYGKADKASDWLQSQHHHLQQQQQQQNQSARSRSLECINSADMDLFRPSLPQGAKGGHLGKSGPYISTPPFQDCSHSGPAPTTQSSEGLTSSSKGGQHQGRTNGSGCTLERGGQKVARIRHQQHRPGLEAGGDLGNSGQEMKRKLELASLGYGNSEQQHLPHWAMRGQQIQAEEEQRKNYLDPFSSGSRQQSQQNQQQQQQQQQGMPPYSSSQQETQASQGESSAMKSLLKYSSQQQPLLLAQKSPFGGLGSLKTPSNSNSISCALQDAKQPLPPRKGPPHDSERQDCGGGRSREAGDGPHGEGEVRQPPVGIAVAVARQREPQSHPPDGHPGHSRQGRVLPAMKGVPRSVFSLDAEGEERKRLCEDQLGMPCLDRDRELFIRGCGNVLTVSFSPGSLQLPVAEGEGEVKVRKQTPSRPGKRRNESRERDGEKRAKGLRQQQQHEQGWTDPSARSSLYRASARVHPSSTPSERLRKATRKNKALQGSSKQKKSSVLGGALSPRRQECVSSKGKNNSKLSSKPVLDVRPQSEQELTSGTRVCAYWSERSRCLYPGYVRRGGPNEEEKEGFVMVEFDDGDSGRISLSNIRLLPPDYQIQSTETSPAMLISNGRRKCRKAAVVKTLQGDSAQRASPERQSHTEPDRTQGRRTASKGKTGKVKTANSGTNSTASGSLCKSNSSSNNSSPLLSWPGVALPKKRTPHKVGMGLQNLFQLSGNPRKMSKSKETGSGGFTLNPLSTPPSTPAKTIFSSSFEVDSFSSIANGYSSFGSQAGLPLSPRNNTSSRGKRLLHDGGQRGRKAGRGAEFLVKLDHEGVTSPKTKNGKALLLLGNAGSNGSVEKGFGAKEVVVVDASPVGYTHPVLLVKDNKKGGGSRADLLLKGAGQLRKPPASSLGLGEYSEFGMNCDSDCHSSYSDMDEEDDEEEDDERNNGLRNAGRFLSQLSVSSTSSVSSSSSSSGSLSSSSLCSSDNDSSYSSEDEEGTLLLQSCLSSHPSVPMALLQPPEPPANAGSFVAKAMAVSSSKPLKRKESPSYSSLKTAKDLAKRQRLPSVDNGPKISNFLPARQLWRWSGNPTQRRGMKGKARKLFYKAIVRGKEAVHVGDCAVFLSAGRPHLPYIGRIESFWESWASNMVVKVKWFYHPEETKLGKRHRDGRHALYQSCHEDENDVQTISHKCQVVNLEEYECLSQGRKHHNGQDLYYLAGTYDPTTGQLVTAQGLSILC
ncbi:UNVERIFIED_CONTAM: hypothetical protein FKN15_024192 [Acipenser sinensis]